MSTRRIRVRSLVEENIGNVEIVIEDGDDEHAVPERTVLDIGPGALAAVATAASRRFGRSAGIDIRSCCKQSADRSYISLANGIVQRGLLVVCLRSCFGPPRRAAF